MTLKQLIGGREKMDALMQRLRFLPDAPYLKLMFLVGKKKRLNLKNPVTYNEKLQWLKLHDRRPEYRQMVDKHEAKKHIASIVGDEYIVPSLGVWDRFEEIDFGSLPQKFVLKCTHDSGGVVICRDKRTLDMDGARRKIERSMKHDFFWIGREWPYKNLKARILAEKYLEGDENGNLKDYKIFCFNGEPGIVMTVEGGHAKESGVVRRMYTPEWKLYEVGLHGKEFVNDPEPRPERLDEMLELARRLSKGIRHLRVDMYLADGRIYIGELTFYHMTGMEVFKPESFDKLFGDMISLNP